MASAVTVTFSANSAQFQAELKRMELMTRAAGRGMSSGLGAMGGGRHGPVGMTGIIRESTVISREIMMGRGLGRILGSMSLLVQYIQSAANAHRALDEASVISANLLKNEALAAKDLSKELEAKSVASALTAANTKKEAQAALEVVTHYEQEAMFAKQAAAALREKATASAIAAKAAKDGAVQAEYNKVLQKISLGQPVQLPVEIVGVGNLKGRGKDEIDAMLAVTGAKTAILEANSAAMTRNVAALEAVAVADTEAATAADANAAAMTFKLGVAEQTLAATVANVAANEAVAASDLEAAVAAEAHASALTAEASEALLLTTAANSLNGEMIGLAVSEKMAAAGIVEVEAAAIPILPLLIAIAAVLIVLYGAYKAVSVVIHHFSEMHVKAAQLARDSNLNFKEEAAALNKLEEAAKRTEEALRKMNEAHSETAKHSEEVLKAMEKEADAQRHLYDVRKESALLAVEKDLADGKITPEQAILRRAAIEKQAIDDKRNYKVTELLALRERSAIDARLAGAQAKADQNAYQAASDKVNATPEGRNNAKELDRLKKNEERARKSADESADKAVKMKFGSPEKAREEQHADMMNQLADVAHAQVVEQERRMKPDELNAAELMRKAEESTKAARAMDEKHDGYVKAWAAAKTDTTGQAADATEKQNIDRKAALEIEKAESKDKKGYSINSQQRLGAYASTAPVLLQQLAALRVIEHNTAPSHPPSNPPPGPKPPQLGTKPKSVVHRSDGWTDFNY